MGALDVVVIVCALLSAALSLVAARRAATEPARSTLAGPRVYYGLVVLWLFVAALKVGEFAFAWRVRRGALFAAVAITRRRAMRPTSSCSRNEKTPPERGFR